MVGNVFKLRPCIIYIKLLARIQVHHDEPYVNVQLLCILMLCKPLYFSYVFRASVKNLPLTKEFEHMFPFAVGVAIVISCAYHLLEAFSL